MYNFNHLYYFYMTAKSNGVSAAAEYLNISQPSLSSQLKVLEHQLDIRLFHRVGRNNKLTPEGAVVFGFCRQMFELSEQMGELITKKVPSAARRIHIGVSTEVDRLFITEVVSHFLKKHGSLQRPKVSVVSGNHDELSERLRFRELDVVVTQLAMIDPELENLQRTEVPVALTCSDDWKSSHFKKNQSAKVMMQSLRERNDLQWLMPSSKFKLRTETDQFIETSKIKGRIVFESDVISSVVRSVIDGIGVALLPLLYVAREVREKKIHAIGPKQGFWKYRVWLTCHKQNKNDPLVQTLSQSFKEISDQALG